MTLLSRSQTAALGLILTVGLTATSAALAEGKKHKATDVAIDQAPVSATVESLVADRVFTDREKSTIRDYYRAQHTSDIGEQDDDDDDGKGKGKSKGAKGKGKSKDMPHGLAKRDDLPPGLAMQLEKNGTLPPGLAKRDLPNDLDGLLPKRRSGERRVIVDDRVILMDENTGVVLDILDGVFGGGR